jgi:hypothetical protein
MSVQFKSYGVVFKRALGVLGLSVMAVLAGCSSNSPGDASDEAVLKAADAGGALLPLQKSLSEDAAVQFADQWIGDADPDLRQAFLCADRALSQGILGSVDMMLTAYRDSSASADLSRLAPDSQQLEGALQSLVVSLAGLIGSWSGDASICTSGEVTIAQVRGLERALDGSPLQPLARSLGPALYNAAVLSKSGSLDLGLFANAVNYLDGSMRDGLSQIPVDVRNSPIVGSALLAVSDGLNRLRSTVILANNKRMPEFAESLEGSIAQLISAPLTALIPLQFIEAQNPEAAEQFEVSAEELDQQSRSASSEIVAKAGSGAPLLDLLELVGGLTRPIVQGLLNNLLPTLLAPALAAIVAPAVELALNVAAGTLSAVIELLRGG